MEMVLTFDNKGQEAITQDMMDQIKDLGYESYNVIRNLGTLAISLSVYFIWLPILLGFYLAALNMNSK